MALTRNRRQLAGALHERVIALHPDVAAIMFDTNVLEWLSGGMCPTPAVTELAREILMDKRGDQGVLAAALLGEPLPSPNVVDVFYRLRSLRDKGGKLPEDDDAAVLYVEAVERSLEGEATAVTYELWFNRHARHPPIVQPHHVMGHIASCSDRGRAAEAIDGWATLRTPLAADSQVAGDRVAKFAAGTIDAL